MRSNNALALILILCPLAALGAVSSTQSIHLKKHTAFTRPLPLRQGEVTNSFHKLEIPKGPIAVHGFAADVVEIEEDGKVVPTPLYDAYLHHHVVGSNHRDYQSFKDTWTPMKPKSFYKSIGFGAGTESRGTPQKFYFPYAFLTMEGEDSWIANVHVINTRDLSASDAHHCLECPCTTENSNADQLFNGSFLSWNSCNGELLEERNSACFPETYHGGLRCCEDQTFCSLKTNFDSKAVSTYYLRYTIEYTDVTPETRPLYLASCCDASGNTSFYGNVEYDIAPCDPVTNPGCVHTLSTKQYIRGGYDDAFGISKHVLPHQIEEREIELVYAVGHQHRGGMGIHLYNDATSELICSSLPEYGTGDSIGNENGYIVAMTHCSFNPPLRMKTTDLLTIVALYNNTVAHTGVMSLFYLAISDVKQEENTAELNGSFLSESFTSFALVISLLGVVTFTVVWRQMKKRREEYTPLVLSEPSS